MPSTVADAGVLRGLPGKACRWAGCALLAALIGACDERGQAASERRDLSAAPDCVPQDGCRLQADALIVRLKFEREAQALKPFPVRVEIDSPVPVDAVGLSFRMRGMDMGQNRYRLIQRTPQRWEGSITLPVCVSGRSDWEARLRIVTPQREYQASLPFVLHP